MEVEFERCDIEKAEKAAKKILLHEGKEYILGITPEYIKAALICARAVIELKSQLDYLLEECNIEIKL